MGESLVSARSAQFGLIGSTCRYDTTLAYCAPKRLQFDCAGPY